MDALYVIAVMYNPMRYQTRYRLYKNFEKHMIDSGAILYTVECRFGERDYIAVDPDNPRHILVETLEEIWHKENLINVGISRLPIDWKYVAWIDADLQFSRPDWVEETVHQLQHYQFIQMFSHAIDLGPKYNPMQTQMGFVYNYLNKYHTHVDDLRGPHDYYKNLIGHPGYAWAANRYAINKTGGLIDWAILGSADAHMAYALINKVRWTFYPDLSKGYRTLLLKWQDCCNRYIHKDIGYLDNTVLHYWHGKKGDRGYRNRHKIIVNNKFNPIRDLTKDSFGLIQIHDNNIALRDDLRFYFRNRNEDSIDT